jgi:hypothetical protein
MKTKIKLPIIILFLWLLCWFKPAEALTNIKVEENNVDFYSLIAIHQNFLQKSESLILNEDTLNLLNESLSFAIKEKAPFATIHNLKASLNINEKWFNISLTFKIEGISKNAGNKIIVDCSWKNFQIKNNLTINGIEFNKVGETYLTPLIKKYENSSEARFWINETHSVSPEKALEIATNFAALDFKEFSAPLESWNKTYNVKMQKTIFQYNAPSKINFNLTVKEENKSLSYILKFDSKAEISVFGYAKAIGDTLIFESIKEKKEKDIAITILILFLIVVSLHLYEKKYLK